MRGVITPPMAAGDTAPAAHGDFVITRAVACLWGAGWRVLVSEAASWSSSAGTPARASPGWKGWLMSCAMKTTAPTLTNIEVVLVEAGVGLSARQEATLRGCSLDAVDTGLVRETALDAAYREAHIAGATADQQIPLRWYRHLTTVPAAEPNVFTLAIAHEFFDALPTISLSAWGSIRLIDIHADPSKHRLNSGSRRPHGSGPKRGRVSEPLFTRDRAASRRGCL